MLSEQSVSCSTVNPTHFLEKYSESRWIMRYLRYIYYPLAIKRLSRELASICHVVDHGYAHLAKSLPKSATTVVTVHDLIPFLTWRGIIPSENRVRPSLNLYSMGFVKRFDCVVTPSQNTANDLSKFFQVDPERICVIPPVLPNYFCINDRPINRNIRSEFGFKESDKLILLTGSDHYKNWQTSLLVVKRLTELGHDIKVIKTGLPSPEFKAMSERLNLERRIHTCFIETHEQMADIYASVDCLLFPSWYEGFGMPVAESLACGTPVVSSNKASLAEVGGNFVLYAEPDDVDMLANHVEKAFYDESVSNRIRTQGNAWLQQFRMDAVFEKYTSLYRLC